MATKVAYYQATTAKSPASTTTALEAETDIAAAVAVGGLGETVEAFNTVVFEVTTGNVLDEAAADTALSNAVTAVGGLIAHPKPAVYTP